MSVVGQQNFNDNHPAGDQFDRRAGGTHTNRAMPESPTREEIAAQLALVESRTDNKILRMETKMDLVIGKLDGMNTRLDAISTRFDDSRAAINKRFDDVRDDNRATRTNQWVILGIIVAVLALIAFVYDFGIRKGETAHQSSPAAASTVK